jgi:hypothetical protein
MKEAKSMAQIIGYLHSQIFIATVEISCHLEVNGEPTKGRIEEILSRLEKTLVESDEMWNNRLTE